MWVVGRGPMARKLDEQSWKKEKEDKEEEEISNMPYQVASSYILRYSLARNVARPRFVVGL
jgi:hypothetical protein